MMRTYELLSRVYDIGWGAFAEQYSSLIGHILDERGVRRARILDIACGTGILAISLAGRRHIVHGIDISSDMVAVAKSKSVGMPDVSFEVQDMTRFLVRDEFDLVACTFDSLNYVLDIDGVEAMFSRVASALKESGLFIFDSNTHQHYINVGNGSQERELGGQSFVQKWSYDPVKREATITFAFFDGFKEIHRQRPYDLSELSSVLSGTGLRLDQAWSWFDRRPYEPRSAKLFCLAERKT